MPLPFLSLTNTFTDKREYQTNMFVTQIDVAPMPIGLVRMQPLLPQIQRQRLFHVLYVADRRNRHTNSSPWCASSMAHLPYNGGLGFSVATPNPLYVKGNYNVTADGAHLPITGLDHQ